MNDNLIPWHDPEIVFGPNDIFEEKETVAPYASLQVFALLLIP